MSYSSTPNLALRKPVVGAEADAWGGDWNWNADTLDSTIHSLGTHLNVLGYGAKGDGTTNDTTAIQNALNAGAAQGLPVMIPNTGNVYMITALAVPANSHIIIDGTLRRIVGSGVANMLALNGSNIWIEGKGTLDANHVVGSCIGTGTGPISDIQITGITMRNAGYWNLNITNASRVRVGQVTLLGGGNSNEFAQTCDDCWISESYVLGMPDGAFSFYGNVTNSGIIGCRIDGNAQSDIGIYIYCDDAQPAACSNITVADNLVSNCMWGGIAVMANNSSSPPQHTGITINNNRCWSNDTANTQFAEIWCRDGRQVVIEGNNLGPSPYTGGGWYGGVFVGNHSSGVAVTNNVIRNEGTGGSTGVGIYLQNAPDVVVTGNQVLDDQTTHSMGWGIAGACGVRNRIAGNNFSGPFIASFYASLTFQPDTVMQDIIQQQAPLALGQQVQGALMGWDYSPGSGAMDLISSRGLGPGGFNFWKMDTAPGATPTRLMTLDGSGGLTPAGPLVVTATGGTTARSVQDRFAEIIDVRDFGAVANGTTDDHTAVQNALNAVGANGATVFLPGLCAVSGPLIIKARTRLVGNGPGSGLVVIAPFASQAALLKNTNYTATTLTDHDITIANLTLDFGYWTGDGASHLIFLAYVQNANVLDCVLKVNRCGDAVGLVGCDNTLIRGCSAYDFANCAYDHWSGPTNARVVNCYARTAQAIQVVNFNPELITGAAGPLADSFVLADCELVCTGAAAVPCQLEPLGPGDNAANIIVSGNVFKNCTIAARRATRNVTINGNTFVACLTAAPVIDVYTLDGGTPTDYVISDNNITDPGTISANGGVIRCYINNATIIGNRISGTLSAPAIDTSTFTPTVMGNSIPAAATVNTPNAVAAAGVFPSLTTSGALTAGAGVTVNGGWLTAAYNASGGTPPGGNTGSIAWNVTGGGAEVDYINNYTGPTDAHIFWQRTGATTKTRLLDIDPSGNLIAYGYSLRIGGASGPLWYVGTGAPSLVVPRGSMYSRSDGAVGTTFYVSQGGGVWNAVAGV